MTLPPPAEWPIHSPPLVGGDVLRARAETTPDREALVDADTDDAWTFAAFDRRADAVAAGLERVLDEASPPASGEGESDAGRVGLLLGTRPAFAALFFASARIGGRQATEGPGSGRSDGVGRPLVPLNVRLDRATLADQARRADLSVLVCGDGTADLARAVAPAEVPVVSVDGDGPDGVRGLPAAEGDGRPDPGRLGGRAGADAAERLVLFTSGTTGRPKGVRLTTGNLIASAWASAFRLGVGADDRWLVVLPAYHMGGLAPIVRSTLYGTTAVVRREFDAERTRRDLTERAITGVSLVPTTLDRLLGTGWRPAEGDPLRFVLLGGGPAPESLVGDALARGVPVCPTYGATETASQVATATPAEAADHPGTVGWPLRGTEVHVVDDDDAPVPEGAVGELVVDGPTVSPGYLDGAATEAAFDADRFHTGDLGRREDGLLWVLGRVDDLIHTGGENVRPGKVAAALRADERVADAAVVGVPDEEWGERVAALAVPADGATVDPEAVRERVRDSLADFEVPKTVRVVDALPRTASGTVDRERARELADAEP